MTFTQLCDIDIEMRNIRDELAYKRRRYNDLVDRLDAAAEYLADKSAAYTVLSHSVPKIDREAARSVLDKARDRYASLREHAATSVMVIDALDEKLQELSSKRDAVAGQ
jgi:chromosome segregation ATPase